MGEKENVSLEVLVERVGNLANIVKEEIEEQSKFRAEIRISDTKQNLRIARTEDGVAALKDNLKKKTSNTLSVWVIAVALVSAVSALITAFK